MAPLSYVKNLGMSVKVDCLHSSQLKQTIDGHMVKSIHVKMGNMNVGACKNEMK